MTKKVSKIVLYSFLSVFLAIIILAGYTQTGAFRANLRSALYEVLKNNLNASVYIGEIEGSVVTGFTIDTVMIYVDNAPFIESGRIGVRYDLLDLLRNQVNVDSVTLENPTVHLIRWKDGSWNVDHLTQADSSTDSTPSPWVVNARALRLSNASFYLIDSTGGYNATTTVDGQKAVNYSNLALTDIHLAATALYSSGRLNADIASLSFRSPREKFLMNALSLQFRYSKDTARVSGLTIRTGETLLQCDAVVSGVDIFSVSDLTEFENAQTTLSLRPSTVASSDLHVFLPELYFLKGIVKIDGEFQGTFAQLNIAKLNASFAKTDLHLSGTVSNIHQPEELRLNVVSKQSTINPPDVPELLPYFNIPLYTQLGELTMDFQFVGKPLDFVVISKIQSSAGTVTVDGEMVITEENLHYKGLFAGTNVDLEKILESSDFASRLNTRAFIEGSGTSIDQLNTEARVEIDSSRFRGIEVSSATVTMKAKERTIDAEIALNSPEGNVHAATLLDFRTEEPAYMLSTRVRNLNLAPILRDDYYISRVSFDLNRNAKTFDLFNGISNTNITILPSSFREYSFDSTSVTLRVDLDSTNSRRITVQSPVANAELRGNFTFSGFINTLQKGVGHIVRLYSYQRQVVDSGFTALREPDTSSVAAADTSENDILYKIELKNLRPISVFFNLPMIDIQGILNGTLVGAGNKTDFSGDLKMNKGIFAQDSTVIQARQASLHYHFADINGKGNGHPLPISVALNLDAAEVAVNSTVLRFPKANIAYDGENGSYNLYSDIDTTIAFAVEGAINVNPLEERLTFSRFFVKFQGFDVANARPFSATLSREGFAIDSAIMFHRDQELILNGTYTFNGDIKASAAINDFALSDLYYFSRSPEFRNSALFMGGTFDARANLHGSIDDPQFDVELSGDDLSYQESVFGSLKGLVSYRDKAASLSVEMKNSTDSAGIPDVRLTGTVPIDLRFRSVADRTGLPGLAAELQTENLQMSALDPFIPELKNMEGRVKGNLAITGSLKEPDINGSVRLDSGSFVFEMTGITYLGQGTIQFSGNRATFTDFTIMNDPEDFSPSSMNVGGQIVFKGFVPDEYHLSANGELLVLQNKSRTPGSAFFGTLVASTGDDSLHFNGNYLRSRITGIVLVRQASLIFPPTQQATAYSSSIYNTVEFIDDTSKPVIDSTIVESLLHSAQQMFTAPKSAGRTFLDGFGYDLTIQTSGTVGVRMIFNANAGAVEELYAELNGKLMLSKDANGMQLKGAINVGNESKYTFYKTFNASGALSFVGDAQNPQLNILATYEGTHCIATDPVNKNCIDEERVVVTLKISGTRNTPQVKLGLKTIDKNGKEIERTGDVENDAISFLLTSSSGTPGKFRDELTAQDRNLISEQLTSTIGGTYINSLLSSYMMDFVTRNNIPFVKRLEVSDVYGDPNISLRIELFDAVINAGGRVFSNINNTNFSVQRPVLGKATPNFMLEVEKKTENFNYSLGSRTILSARIYYRFLF